MWWALILLKYLCVDGWVYTVLCLDGLDTGSFMPLFHMEWILKSPQGKNKQGNHYIGIPLGKEFKCIRSWAWWLWAFISWLKLWRNNSKVARTNIYLPMPDDSSSYWIILIRPSSEVKSLEATDCRSAVLITSWVTPWGLRWMPTRATKKPKRWTGPREHRNTVWI